MARHGSTNIAKACLTGSFDPPTLGHLDIIERAKKLPFQLVIGIGENPEKKAFLPIATRKKLLEELTGLEVIIIKGLSAEYLKKNNFDWIIRGARNGSDFEFEETMAALNRDQTGIDTLILCSSHPAIEGRFIREIIKQKGKLTPFLPKLVIKALQG